MEEYVLGSGLLLLVLWLIYRQVLKRNPKFRAKKFKKAEKQMWKWR